MRIEFNCSDTKKIIPWGGCRKFMLEDGEHDWRFEHRGQYLLIQLIQK